MADPAVNKEVEIANAEARKLSDQVLKVRVRSDADQSEATKMLVEVKRVAKEIEKRRKTITQPLNLAIKEVNALFKDPADRLADAEKIIKDALLKYQDMVERRAAKRADKIEGQVDSGELGMADAVGKLGNIKQAETNVKTEGGGANFKTVTKIRIINPAELPATYFLRPRVIEALRVEVEEDVRKKALPVPAGAESYEERQVAVRTAV